MTEQAAFDFEAARAARDAGIHRATAHADRVNPKWSDDAYAFLERHARTSPLFTTEDVRAASAGEVPDPPDSRAWGGVVLRAVRAGLLELDGYMTARDPKVHCNVVKRWRSRLCRSAA